MERCWGNIQRHAVDSDFLLILEEDQADDYPRTEGVERLIVPAGTGSCGKGRALYASGIWERYETCLFLADDIVVHTPRFDELLAEPIREHGYGWAYSEDGNIGRHLPSHWMVSTNIIRTLGWIVPDGFIHLYVDNVTKELGDRMEALFFRGDVLMEHMTHRSGKGEEDDTARMNDTPEVWDNDRTLFNKYVLEQVGKDVERLKAALT